MLAIKSVSHQQFSFFHLYLHVCDQLSGLVMERRRPTGPGNGRTNAGSDFELCCAVLCAVCCCAVLCAVGKTENTKISRN